MTEEQITTTKQYVYKIDDNDNRVLYTSIYECFRTYLKFLIDELTGDGCGIAYLEKAISRSPTPTEQLHEGSYENQLIRARQQLIDYTNVFSSLTKDNYGQYLRSPTEEELDSGDVVVGDQYITICGQQVATIDTIDAAVKGKTPKVETVFSCDVIHRYEIL